MNELPRQWRVFKGFSIVQMVLVTFFLVVSVSGVFSSGNVFWRMFESICYGCMLIFLYQGFTILNDNYPDTALSLKQKRSFNIFFLINFLMIAFVFAKLINQWRWAGILWSDSGLTSRSIILVATPLLMSLLVFVLHIMYLAGMYRLRVLIHQNSSKILDDI
ncbi:MAG: hypothetical protein EOO02_01805 [Chitinophagaceae bacterium]|nr:MAG: hypothetical protein EOO02_01805 [Chitinophagaceae bacterium]